MTVLAGNEGRWKYVEGGPPTVLELRKMDSDGEGMLRAGVWWKLRCVCEDAATLARLELLSSCPREVWTSARAGEALHIAEAMVMCV